MAKNSLALSLYCREVFEKLHKEDEDMVCLDVENITMPNIEIVCVYKNLSRHAKVFVEKLKEFCKGL